MPHKCLPCRYFLLLFLSLLSLSLNLTPLLLSLTPLPVLLLLRQLLLFLLSFCFPPLSLMVVLSADRVGIGHSDVGVMVSNGTDKKQ